MIQFENEHLWLIWMERE